ncbi:hypothetical protein M422DRAFT_254200 [Sphaerobolus stellatus SS14]|uniref:Uncharacterized protein n=1 Tax=Sphaerobolus stellatus (strain SS14) TaxID=990650 RepID=A0A0C9VLU1_SPHS4|nr:hypothetical protein M422DRAFT_254200 [Sphaerobolus stellatus SS14]
MLRYIRPCRQYRGLTCFHRPIWVNASVETGMQLTVVADGVDVVVNWSWVASSFLQLGRLWTPPSFAFDVDVDAVLMTRPMQQQRHSHNTPVTVQANASTGTAVLLLLVVMLAFTIRVDLAASGASSVIVSASSRRLYNPHISITSEQSKDVELTFQPRLPHNRPTSSCNLRTQLALDTTIHPK